MSKSNLIANVSGSRSTMEYAVSMNSVLKEPTSPNTVDIVLQRYGVRHGLKIEVHQINDAIALVESFSGVHVAAFLSSACFSISN